MMANVWSCVLTLRASCNFQTFHENISVTFSTTVKVCAKRKWKCGICLARV